MSRIESPLQFCVRDPFPGCEETGPFDDVCTTWGPLSRGSAEAELILGIVPVGRYAVRATYDPAPAAVPAFEASGATALGALVVATMTFTATVTPQEGGEPTGTVNFIDSDGMTIGRGTLAVENGQSVAVHSSRMTHDGPKAIAAEYVGDANFVGSRTDAPVIRLTPESRDFGTRVVKTTSERRTFTLTNVGNTELAVVIAIAGPDADDFAQSPTPPAARCIFR